jgi:hypothetical protein
MRKIIMYGIASNPHDGWENIHWNIKAELRGLEHCIRFHVIVEYDVDAAGEGYWNAQRLCRRYLDKALAWHCVKDGSFRAETKG